jgi:GNAT superfamily N-acetyltransferase
MSLYSDYLRERTSDFIHEDERGFATYRYLNDKQVYIVDIYVRPDFRKNGVASEFANRIAAEAKAKGCIEMLGTVNPSTNGSTESLLVLVAYGMMLHSSTNNVIVMKKDI